jgi:hypothetical protein
MIQIDSYMIEPHTTPATINDRSHALRGNAALDALRPLLTS